MSRRLPDTRYVYMIDIIEMLRHNIATICCHSSKSSQCACGSCNAVGGGGFANAHAIPATNRFAYVAMLLMPCRTGACRACHIRLLLPPCFEVPLICATPPLRRLRVAGIYFSRPPAREKRSPPLAAQRRFQAFAFYDAVVFYTLMPASPSSLALLAAPGAILPAAYRMLAPYARLIQSGRLRWRRARYSAFLPPRSLPASFLPPRPSFLPDRASPPAVISSP